MLRKLERLRVPPAAGAAHAETIQAFEAYLDAQRRFHAACIDQIPDEARDAAAELEGIADQLQSAGQRVATLVV